MFSLQTDECDKSPICAGHTAKVILGLSGVDNKLLIDKIVAYFVVSSEHTHTVCGWSTVSASSASGCFPSLTNSLVCVIVCVCVSQPPYGAVMRHIG